MRLCSIISLMKKGFYVISVLFLLFSCLFATGCASTGAGKGAETEEAFVEPPLFLDWQYKGFGQEYPQWAEQALKEGESAAVSIQFGQNLDMLIPHEYEETQEIEEETENAVKIIKQTWVYIDPYYGEYEARYAFITLRQAQEPRGMED